MADTLSPEYRSEIMSRITGRNTQPEVAVRKLLHRMGYRFRLHRKDLPGKPDIVLSKWKTIVFVHGCFWHGHECRRGKMPSTNTDFWVEKIRKNRERDSIVVEKLRKIGWRTMIVWQCELNDVDSLRLRLKGIAADHA
jgi:DNA mismatch endonuclease (patch repair protein)